MKQGIFLFNKFYCKIIQFFAERDFDCCLWIDGEIARVDFTIALQRDWSLVETIESWDEWKVLEQWLNDNGVQSVHFFGLVRRVNDIVNEQKLFSIHRSLQRRNALPQLDQGLISEANFASVMVDGHSNGFIPDAGKTIILIQGLKLRKEVKVGAYGDLIQLDDRYLDGFTQKPVSGGVSHLYSGFLTTDPVFLERKGLAALMASLRCYKYARSGDLRYAGTILLGQSLTGKEITQRKGGTVVYTEETALFGTEAPRLIEVGKPGALMLARHIENTLEGHQKNLIASELLSRALIAPKHLRVPSLFSVLEAVLFVRDRFTKKRAIAAFVAEVLQLSRGRADFLIKMYDLRNAIIHGDDIELQSANHDLWRNRLHYEMRTDSTAELTEIVCQFIKRLMMSNWDAKPGTRQLESNVYQNPDLRDLLQNRN